MPLNKGFILASRPQGVATEGNFHFFERPVDTPGPGQVLLRNLWLSLDPYMRGRMDEARSYSASQALDDMRIMLIRRLTMRGFIVSEFLSDWPQALAELIDLAVAGKLKWRETIAEGIEAAPSAFLGMLKGRNFGKQLVKLG